VDVEHHLGAEVVVDDKRGLLRGGGVRCVRRGQQARRHDIGVDREVGGEEALRGGDGKQFLLRDRNTLQAAEAVGRGGWRAGFEAVAHQVEAGGVDQIAFAIGNE